MDVIFIKLKIKKNCMVLLLCCINDNIVPRNNDKRKANVIHQPLCSYYNNQTFLFPRQTININQDMTKIQVGNDTVVLCSFSIIFLSLFIDSHAFPIKITEKKHTPFLYSTYLHSSF